jgi:hypothetical protein
MPLESGPKAIRRSLRLWTPWWRKTPNDLFLWLLRDDKHIGVGALVCILSDEVGSNHHRSRDDDLDPAIEPEVMSVATRSAHATYRSKNVATRAVTGGEQRVSVPENTLVNLAKQAGINPKKEWSLRVCGVGRRGLKHGFSLIPVAGQRARRLWIVLEPALLGLYCNFNDIRVRSFVLNGAPNISRTWRGSLDRPKACLTQNRCLSISRASGALRARITASSISA